MNDFVVAIPSYHRAEEQITLKYMMSLGLSKDKIFIFVQTEDDYAKYSELYGNDCNVIYRPSDSISKSRNNILNYFAGQENILMMDDDVSEIAFLSSNDLQAISDLSVIDKMFDYTKSNRGYLFGLYPVYNDFFMSNNTSTRVTVNTIIGFPKKFQFRFDESFIAKEDIELCGRILNQGGRVFRFNNFAFKAKHRTNKGGANDTWKTNANEKAVLRLCEMYPAIFAKHKTKNNEVRVIAKDRKVISL